MSTSTADVDNIYSGPLSFSTTGSNSSSTMMNRSLSSRKNANNKLNLPISNNKNSSSGSKDIHHNDADQDSYVEITLDIRDDSVAVHSVQAASGQEDPELALLTKKTLHDASSNKPSSRSSSSSFRSTSSRVLTHVSQELKRLASASGLSIRPSSARRFDRSKSAASHALKGLKFIAAQKGGSSSAVSAWPDVERRFNDLSANSNGLLPSSLFGECIGTLTNFNIILSFFYFIISLLLAS